MDCPLDRVGLGSMSRPGFEGATGRASYRQRPISARGSPCVTAARETPKRATISARAIPGSAASSAPYSNARAGPELAGPCGMGCTRRLFSIVARCLQVRSPRPTGSQLYAVRELREPARLTEPLRRESRGLRHFPLGSQGFAHSRAPLRARCEPPGARGTRFALSLLCPVRGALRREILTGAGTATRRLAVPTPAACPRAPSFARGAAIALVLGVGAVAGSGALASASSPSPWTTSTCYESCRQKRIKPNETVWISQRQLGDESLLGRLHVPPALVVSRAELGLPGLLRSHLLERVLPHHLAGKNH